MKKKHEHRKYYSKRRIKFELSNYYLTSPFFVAMIITRGLPSACRAVCERDKNERFGYDIISNAFRIGMLFGISSFSITVSFTPRCSVSWLSSCVLEIQTEE